MDTNQSKRELLRERRIKQKRRNTLTFAIVTIAVIVLFALAAFLPRILKAQSENGNGRGFAIGNPDAPVTVIQFSNYSCGFCKDFSERVEKDFIAEYVEPGDVYYRFVNIPSNNEDGQSAAKASYCAADQNLFFEYKDDLYTYATAVDGFSTSNLIVYAASAGLETDTFQKCLEANTYTNAYLDDIRYAQAVGITGTPTFLVNDQLVSSNELIPLVNALLSN